MKTVIEVNGYRAEIPRSDLGRELYARKREEGLRVFLVPENDQEVLYQKALARKDAREIRSYAKHICRPNRELKDRFFRGKIESKPPLRQLLEDFHLDDEHYTYGVF